MPGEPLGAAPARRSPPGLCRPGPVERNFRQRQLRMRFLRDAGLPVLIVEKQQIRDDDDRGGKDQNQENRLAGRPCGASLGAGAAAGK